MLIKPISDLHLNFTEGNMEIPEHPSDKDTVLVLAGDIGEVKKPSTYRNFIADMSPRFKAIIYIAGNHDHYGGKFKTTITKIWNELVEFDNVHVVEKETVVIDDTAFICATLWADMDKHNPITMMEAHNVMNDYKYIRNGPINEPWKFKLTPQDTVADHMNAKHFIFEEVKKQKALGNKTVVVTHHGISFLSIDPEYVGDSLNGAYVSELFDDVYDAEYDLHIHGHVHTKLDYMIRKTRVVVNPRGYPHQDTGFDPLLVIKV